MQNVTLNNGVEMPILGFGVFQITDASQCQKAVEEALEVGYRAFDTAASYDNEEAVGRALAHSGIPRQQLFITTKLWVSDAGEGKAARAFDRSLQRLGLDYLDLYLIHQPFGDVYGAWRDMEKLYHQKRVRAIGVSNFLPDRLVDFALHQEVCPAVNQVETNPLFQQQAAAAVMEKYGVQMEAWAPFGEGRRDMFGQPVLMQLAEKHQKSVAQIILRWLLQRQIVCIPKSITRSRMEQNLDVFGFALSDGDMQAIAAMETGESLFFSHTDPAAVERICSLPRNT